MGGIYLRPDIVLGFTAAPCRVISVSLRRLRTMRSDTSHYTRRSTRSPRADMSSAPTKSDFLFLRGLLLGLSIAAPVGPIGLLCVRCSLDAGLAPSPPMPSMPPSLSVGLL